MYIFPSVRDAGDTGGTTTTFLSLSNGLMSRFLSSTCTEVSGVENIGHCGRLSQLSWLFGAL